MAIAQRILNLPIRSDSRSDRSLVRAAQKGDRRAAGALVERYYGRIYSFVSHMGANGHAEDFTQEVFARALTALPKFNGTYQVCPWLLRIAKNLCIDESRRDHFRPPPVDPAELPEFERDDAPDNVWESVSEQFAGSAVRHALSRMPPRQRVTLVLREIEQLSYADIAQVIGTNIRGAEATLRRARARFRMEIVNSQTVEGQKATCRRVLRLVADNQTPTIEVTRHLKTCDACRTKASTIRIADKLLGALPPLAIGRPLWKSELVMRLRPQRPRGIMQILRGHGELGFVSPLGQVAEMVSTLVMASAVTVASVGQSVQRLAVASASPPSVAAQAGSSVPATAADADASNPPAPDQPAAAPSVPATPAVPETVPTAAVDSQVSKVQNAVSETVQTATDTVTDIVGTAEGAAGSVPIDTDPNDPLPDPLPQTNAALPTGIALPRRRRIPYWS